MLIVLFGHAELIGMVIDLDIVFFSHFFYFLRLLYHVVIYVLISFFFFFSLFLRHGLTR